MRSPTAATALACHATVVRTCRRVNPSVLSTASSRRRRRTEETRPSPTATSATTATKAASATGKPRIWRTRSISVGTVNRTSPPRPLGGRDLARELRAVRSGSEAHDDVPAAVGAQTIQSARGEGGAIGERLRVGQAGERHLPHDAERLRSARAGDLHVVTDRAVHGGEGLRAEGDLVVGPRRSAGDDCRSDVASDLVVPPSRDRTTGDLDAAVAHRCDVGDAGDAGEARREG